MPQRLNISKVKSKMNELGLTTSKLVARSQLSESTVDRILHGRANNYSDFTLNRLASALNCPVLELLDDESTAAALTAFTVKTVESVIEEAIVENVTAVVGTLAPDTPPEVVAENVPNTPVAVPSAMDVSSYFQYIQDQHKQELSDLKQSFQDRTADIRRERDVWRAVSLGLIAIICVAFVIASFVR